MNPVLVAVLVLGGVGLVCAVLLVVASKFMAVPVDERFPKIKGVPPRRELRRLRIRGL